MTTALPIYPLPGEYRQQGNLQGYGAPYEQLRNRDLVRKMANTLMFESWGVNVSNYPYEHPEGSAPPAFVVTVLNLAKEFINGTIA